MKNIFRPDLWVKLGFVLGFLGIACGVIHTINKLNTPKIEIYSVYHKDFPVYKNDVVIPIHAGRALKRDFGRPLLNKMIGDDTGLNISERNNRYAELTVLYWAWKNSKADYVGLMHYRRSLILDSSSIPGVSPYKHCYNYLCVLGITHNNLAPLLQNYDIISHEKIILRGVSLRAQYERAHVKDDLFLAINYIQKHYPEMTRVAFNTLHNNRFSNTNIFIMRKDIFDQYCEWLFDILFHIEPQLSYQRGYQERAPGYLSERLWTIWINYQLERSQYRIKFAPVHMFDAKDSLSLVTYKNNNDKRFER